MRVQCPNCGGDHPKWECRRPAAKSREDKAQASAGVKPNLERQLDPVKSAGLSRTKSTAARKDVLRTEVEIAQGGVRLPKANGSTPDAVGTKRKAGTQALPVDTTIRKPGRPSTGFDKAAYNRAYMRQYRARKKASAEGRE